MAITGAIFNSLSFGGVNSADYGIYITGEGVFNAPKRAVNMVAVPGRNGSIAIDQGHWENIEVTYPAGTFGMDEEEFRTALSNFRNAIASQVGYQRLTDTYHPDEYRMAIYTDGLEVEPTTYNKAGEFELKFNCKPQRWLTSGEVPVTIGEWGATKEASGEIVTIESEGGEAAKSLEVSLEPIQDLNGYDGPWVGGAGKNKFDGSAVTTTTPNNWGVVWNSSSNTLTIEHKNSYSTGTPELALSLDAGTYIISGTLGANIGLYINGAYSTSLKNGSTFTLSDGDTAYLTFGNTVASTLTYKNVQIESGTTITSYEPYENICPISGRTEVVTNVAGKNLFEASTSGGQTNGGITWTYNSDGSLTASGTATGNSWSYVTAPSVTLPSGTYTVSVSSPFSLVIRRSDNTNIYNGDNATHTFTLSEPTEIFIHARIKTGTTVNNATTGIMLEVGSSASEWQPYNGQTYTTALGRTVYGGTLDVVSGELVVDRAMVDLGSLNWRGIGLGTEYARFVSSDISSTVKTPPNNATPTTAICEQYSAIGASNLPSNNGTFGVYTDGDIGIKDESYADVASFKTAMNGVQLCYELATPQTYQLTPQQMTLLLGTNHLWSDGEITVEYGDDPNSLWNPTQYDAGPIVSAEGYGVIRFNGYEIDLEDMSFGDILLHNVYQSHNATQKLTIPFDRGFYRAGNAIKIYGLKIRSTVSPVSGRRFQRVTMDWNEDSPRTTPTLTSGVGSDGSAYFQMAWNTVSFDVDSTWTLEYITDQTIDVYGESLTLTDAGRKQTIIKTDDSIILDLTNFFTKGFSRFFSGHTYEISFERIVGHSTATLIDGADFRIDCELGEAFMIKNGVLSNLNGYVDLGSDLPKLKSGNNPVEADSTITKLVITPNWWKL